MTRVAVVSNVLSRRNARGLGAVAAVLAGAPGVEHHVLDHIERLPAVLAAVARDGADVLAVNGGDGTVQAVLTELLERRALPAVPALAVIAGGTTNAIAGDVGVRGRPARAVARLVELVRAGQLDSRLVEREVLRVHVGAGPTRCGMLFGAAGVTGGIRLRRTLFPQRCVPDAVAAGITIAGLLAGWAFGSARAERVLAGEDVGIELDGERLPAGRYAIVLVSTLERLILGSRPFWGDGAGPLRFTAIRFPPQGLLRHARTLLYGPPARCLPPGYVSRRFVTAALSLRGEFALDGELYAPAPGTPVRIEPAGRVRFVRL